jgi:hypothetical protein
MKNTMSDQMKKILEDRRLKGGFQSLWEVPLINEEQIHKLNFKERFSIRTKLWLRDWYPIFMIILGALSIIYYILQIFKALRTL